VLTLTNFAARVEHSTTKASTSEKTGGRPGCCRCWEPSNFWATQLACGAATAELPMIGRSRRAIVSRGSLRSSSRSYTESSWISRPPLTRRRRWPGMSLTTLPLLPYKSAWKLDIGQMVLAGDGVLKGVATTLADAFGFEHALRAARRHVDGLIALPWLHSRRLPWFCCRTAF
jgi:hypothetical protein